MKVPENLVKHQFSSKSKKAAKMATSKLNAKQIEAIRGKVT